MSAARLTFAEYLDVIETMWLDTLALTYDIDKALDALDRKADEMLTQAEEWGETAAAEAAQDAMMERFPSALPVEGLLDQ